MRWTVGSLFSGIGGYELGLSRALDCDVRWQVEIDPFCRRVLAKHWPEARRYEDVRQVGAQNLEPVSIICAGFPCQDLSVAGKGAGIEGERSGLWSEVARCTDELVPRYLCLENVPAITFRGLDRVCRDLAQIRYDAVWFCLSAQAMGAPHKRDRWWAIAWPNDGHSHSHSQSAITKHDEAPRVQGMAEEFKASLRACREGPGWWQTISHMGDSPDGLSSRMAGSGVAPWEAGIPRVTQGEPDRMAKLKALGNAVVPQCSEVVGHMIKQIEEARSKSNGAEHN